MTRTRIRFLARSALRRFGPPGGMPAGHYMFCMEDLDPTAFIVAPTLSDTMAEALPARVEGFLREYRAARENGQLDAFIAEQRVRAGDKGWPSKR